MQHDSHTTKFLLLCIQLYECLHILGVRDVHFVCGYAVCSEVLRMINTEYHITCSDHYPLKITPPGLIQWFQQCYNFSQNFVYNCYETGLATVATLFVLPLLIESKPCYTKFHVRKRKSARERPGLYASYGTIGVLFFVRNFWLEVAVCAGALSWRINQLSFHQAPVISFSLLLKYNSRVTIFINIF